MFAVVITYSAAALPASLPQPRGGLLQRRPLRGVAPTVAPHPARPGDAAGVAPLGVREDGQNYLDGASVRRRHVYGPPEVSPPGPPESLHERRGALAPLVALLAVLRLHQLPELI